MNGPTRNGPIREPDTGRTTCDRGPVHAPGTIQPHGLPLELRTAPDGRRPRVAAARGNGFAGQGTMSLAGLLKPVAVARVKHALPGPDVVMDPVLGGLASQDGRPGLDQGRPMHEG